MKSKSKAWWEIFFQDFRPFFAKFSTKETNDQVRYLFQKLRLDKNSSLLDCPVGIGRVAIPLAKKGVKVTGVDITESYLIELEEKVSKKSLPIKLFYADMRKIDFENEFDAAVNLWTSFGYFQKESDNLLVLKKFYKALKPKGMFHIQVINRDWIMLNFSSNGWTEYGNNKILEKRSFDYETSTSLTTWTFLSDGKERNIDTTIRMYSYHELKGMLEKVGFKNVYGYGSLKDDPITNKSREMFIFGEK